MSNLRFDGSVAPAAAWTYTLESNTAYNHVVSATAAGTIIANGGPFSVTIPAGMTLEVRFGAPIADVPAGTGLLGRIVIGGVVRQAWYFSNSNASPFGVPLNVIAEYVGTGVSVTYQVEAWKVGGSPAIQAQGLDSVRIRHRIT